MAAILCYFISAFCCLKKYLQCQRLEEETRIRRVIFLTISIFSPNFTPGKISLGNAPRPENVDAPFSISKSQDGCKCLIKMKYTVDASNPFFFCLTCTPINQMLHQDSVLFLRTGKTVITGKSSACLPGHISIELLQHFHASAGAGSTAAGLWSLTAQPCWGLLSQRHLWQRCSRSVCALIVESE